MEKKVLIIIYQSYRIDNLISVDISVHSHGIINIFGGRVESQDVGASQSLSMEYSIRFLLHLRKTDFKILSPKFNAQKPPAVLNFDS